MILDFRGKDYQCNYYSGKYPINGVCFSSGCERGLIKGYSYTRIIWPRNKQIQLNYCFFNTNTLIAYFIKISKLLGFTLISLKESKNSYELQIKHIPKHRYFIYIATCIRYVYEYPFNILLFAAWQNRKNLPELNIIQIMQFYIAVLHDGRYCHCFGNPRLAFYNINSKCQFNLLRNGFNYNKSFYKIITAHNSLLKYLYVFNLKQICQIVSGINFIINKYYAKNKKYICRW